MTLLADVASCILLCTVQRIMSQSTVSLTVKIRICDLLETKVGQTGVVHVSAHLTPPSPHPPTHPLTYPSQLSASHLQRSRHDAEE